MIVFLIGYMGSGKSSAGRRLAVRLGCTFLDLDDFFEERTGLSTGDFIRDSGEEAFRIEEQKTLRAIPLSGELVVATGGGAPCYGDNMEWMNSNGITVYLEMHVRSIFKRLSESKTERPLLKGLQGEALLHFITGHLAIRAPYYEQADIRVKGENLNIRDLEMQIRSFIKK